VHDPPPGHPFHGDVHQGREHGRAADERRHPLDVVDAVSQHDDHGAWAAEPGQPGPGLRRLLGLGGQQYPVDRPCIVNVADHRRRDPPLSPVAFEHDRPPGRRPRADDHVPSSLLGS